MANDRSPTAESGSVSLSFSAASPETVFPSIREARLRGFPEMAGTEADDEGFFRWKFLGRPSHVFVASDGEGRTVGAYCFIEHLYLCDGKPQRAALAVDAFTDPSIRKQGVFTRLSRFALETLQAKGCDFAIGYVVRPEVMPGHLKVGWRVNHRLPLYLSPVRTKGLLPALPGGISTVLEAAGGVAARVLSRNLSVNGSPGPSLEWVETDGLMAQDGYEEFLRRWTRGKGVVLGEPAEFYKWRYGAPRRTFRHLVIRSHGTLVGIISTRVMPLKGVLGLAISDLQVLPDARRLMSQAWHFLWQVAWKEGLSVMAMMVPNAVARETCALTVPFLPTYIQFKVITRDLCSTAPDLSRSRDLKLMWTDTDDS